MPVPTYHDLEKFSYFALGRKQHTGSYIVREGADKNGLRPQKSNYPVLVRDRPAASSSAGRPRLRFLTTLFDHLDLVLRQVFNSLQSTSGR